MFFADEVVLVEGISDRLFLEKLLDKRGRGSTSKAITEVIDVGGKNLFKAYVKLLRASKVNYSVVADLDYIDIVGTPDIKSLLKVNAKKIKEDVIQNVTSRDADSLVASIDKAIKSGDWSEAADIWEYIKGSRVKLRTDLNPDEVKLLDSFILSQRAENTFLLRKGDLEDYLPDGLKKKDIEKLIVFLDDPDYWSKLKPDAQVELNEIADALLHFT